ncbi:MAG: hypothetical protein ACXAC7_18340, partial [Candidatus Hodarchaeales archaeon]
MGDKLFPFDLTGPEFLNLYFQVMIIVIIIALILHFIYRGQKEQAINSKSSLFRILPALVFMMAVIFGSIKIYVGISRNKPVTILVVLVLFNIILAALFFFWPEFSEGIKNSNSFVSS